MRTMLLSFMALCALALPGCFATGLSLAVGGSLDEQGNFSPGFVGHVGGGFGLSDGGKRDASYGLNPFGLRVQAAYDAQDGWYSEIGPSFQWVQQPAQGDAFGYIAQISAGFDLARSNAGSISLSFTPFAQVARTEAGQHKADNEKGCLVGLEAGCTAITIWSLNLGGMVEPSLTFRSNEAGETELGFRGFVGASLSGSGIQY